MLNSRTAGIISAIGAAATTAAVFLDSLDPRYGVWALALAAAINAFTERVQGGKSKSEK